MPLMTAWTRARWSCTSATPAPCAAACLQAQPNFSGAAAVDEQIEQAVHSGLIPGAVLVIGHAGAVVYRKAYGERALIPSHEPMTVDTIFDAASLTKVVATTPSLMKLFEQGKLRIDDPVTRYLPEFQGGKSDIEQAIGDTFLACIPNDYGLVREAIDRGVPLEEVRKGNKITLQLKQLVLPQPSAKSATASAVKKLSLSLARG